MQRRCTPSNFRTCNMSSSGSLSSRMTARRAVRRRSKEYTFLRATVGAEARLLMDCVPCILASVSLRQAGLALKEWTSQRSREGRQGVVLSLRTEIAEALRGVLTSPPLCAEVSGQRCPSNCVCLLLQRHLWASQGQQAHGPQHARPSREHSMRYWMQLGMALYRLPRLGLVCAWVQCGGGSEGMHRMPHAPRLAWH